MFTYYNNIQLESQIVQPISQTVERQRMDVDAINATRMEEQQRYMGTLDSLNRKYYDLIEKNLRLREAIVGLEGEVEGLTNEGGE
jgi:chromosome segregation ATPase